MTYLDRYQNKYFSILGDSMSTLEGYSQPRHAAFYDTARKYESGVLRPADTWWGMVIDRLGGRLLVNNSISGSMVCKRSADQSPSYGCSDERTSALDWDGDLPDVIMVEMGMNDWGCGAKPTPDSEEEKGDISVFSEAYACMLKKLKANYPEAEIWCFTLPVSTCKRNANFVFPYCYAGRHIEEYCEVIRACAKAQDCRVIDWYSAADPYDTIDDFHPNREGMQTLADMAISQLCEW